MKSVSVFEAKTHLSRYFSARRPEKRSHFAVGQPIARLVPIAEPVAFTLASSLDRLTLVSADRQMTLYAVDLLW